jgi:biotin carboxylase
VPTAAFEQFEDSEAALDFAETLGFPVMVKATDSSGSRGITKVNGREEFQEAWDRAWEVSRSKEIIVEEYLSGLEFGAQAFVKGEKLIAVFPHGDTVTPEPYFTPIGHSIPINFSEEQLQKTKETVEKAVQALGLRDCVSNVDLMFVDGEPKLIELGARMGATCLPENISIYSGTDAYEYLIRLSLGDEVSFPVVDKQPNASFLLQSDRTGKVVHLHVEQEVLDHPDLVDFQWDIQVGDHVRAFQVGPDRIGHIIVRSNTPDEAERLVEELAGKVSVVVEE